MVNFGRKIFRCLFYFGIVLFLWKTKLFFPTPGDQYGFLPQMTSYRFEVCPTAFLLQSMTLPSCTIGEVRLQLAQLSP